MNATIRTIGAEEWPLWRDVRLRALTSSPDAFRPTLEEESAQPDEWWAGTIGATAQHPRGGLWVAESGGETVGMLFGNLSPDLDLLTVGAIWVAPQVRQLGVGRGLLEAAIGWAQAAGASRAELWLSEESSIAQSFFRQAGFRPTAHTRRLREGSRITVRRLVTDL